MLISHSAKCQISEFFSHLATGDVPSLYAHVTNDISWTVLGASVLSRHYPPKASFLSNSLKIISGAFDGGPMKQRVTSIIGE